MLNYANNLFLVILDSSMIVKLANWSLATTLGFENEKEIIGHCWLDFIKTEEKDMIKNIHNLVTNNHEKANEYREVTNDIVLPFGETMVVKWFNIKINNNLNLTISIGIKCNYDYEESEESVRSYYRDVIEKDKTMIKSFRETIINNDLQVIEV